MADEWTTFRLGSVCTKIGSGATPRGGSGVYLDKGPYALIRSQNVYNDRFRAEGLAFIGVKHATELSNVELLRNDVLLNITGDSVARCCQVEESVLPGRVNQHVAIIRPAPDKLDPRFLRYSLVSAETQALLLSWAAAGATRNALTKAMIEALEVFAPWDLGEQRAIAGILGSLDDKIELNRRMNETLEAIARALFKSWFVDFDPARTLADIADLNPEGWSTKNYSTEIRYVDLSNAKWGIIQTIDVYSHTNAPSRAQRVLRAGDTIVGTVRPGNGSYAMSGENGLTGSTGFAVLRPKQPYYREFVYCTATSAENVERLSHLADGAAYPAVNPEVVVATELPSFAEDAVLRFSAVTKPIFDRMEVARQESKNLASIRDFLLPKLISGELRVREAERVVAEAAQ
jgi:type I restriction enzyme S subunit